MVALDRSDAGRVSRRAGVIVIPLGEAPREEVVAALRRHFPTAQVTWLDRTELRRSFPRSVNQLRRRGYEAAVLVAPDLGQSRLRLTSFVLAIPKARQRWRIDLLGNREAFSLRSHVLRNGLAIVRHLLACGLALVAGELLLRLVDACIKPRQRRFEPPTKILYLRSQLWLGLEGGGSVAHTAGVIGGLEQAGVDVQVVSSDRLPGVTAPTDLVPPETWFDGWLREAEDLAYNVAFFGAAMRAARPRRTRPRVIYQRHTAFNVSGALISRLLRLPLVLEFNSSELWKGRYWGGLRLERPAALVERINLRAADRVVVVSEVLKHTVVAAGVPSENVLVNPNGVDPTQFRPDVNAASLRARLGLQDAVVVGFSGTFGRWHGIPTLAQALAPVVQGRSHVRWLLIGDGPLRHLVDEAIDAHGLRGRVNLPGLVPHAEMPTYLAACDVLVSPHGRQADGGEFFGSPTKLFEYMAAGRPIVASAVGQIADVLQDEESALLVPPDDPEALCRAILRLVDDASLRSRLGETARRAAIERHTWRQNAERVLDSLGANQ